MPHRRTAVHLTALAGLLAVGACQDTVTPPEAATLPEQVVAQAPGQDALDRRIPGFGGYYLQGGVPTVYLTDVTRRGEAEAALGSRVRVVQAQYSYKSLDRWHRAVTTEAFEVRGVVYTDL